MLLLLSLGLLSFQLLSYLLSLLIQIFLVGLFGGFAHLLRRGQRGRLRLEGRVRLYAFGGDGFESGWADEVASLVDGECRLWLGRSSLFDYVGAISFVFGESANYKILHGVFDLTFGWLKPHPFFSIAYSLVATCVVLLVVLVLGIFGKM